jgi:lysine 2,3-aminomutase
VERFKLFQGIPEDFWRDWRWQMANSLTNKRRIEDFFPDLPREEAAAFYRYTAQYFLAITPYVLSLIERDSRGNPENTDPIWRQFCYLNESTLSGGDCYNGEDVNWEDPSEFPTEILHHKYPDRAIIRIVNKCFGHCNYCYLTSRVLDRNTAAANREGNSDAWERSVDYLHRTPQVRDVLISGGDPLILSNDRVERILSDLAKIPSIRSVRLNTRVFTFNPFRIDEELVRIFQRYRLTALEVHISHPREITPEVDEALDIFDRVGYRPLMLWRAPLLRGINCFEEVLEELFIKLYERRILPYYIFHYAPFTLGRSGYGVSVREGARILAKLRRRVPGPAFPRYTLFHLQGKQDIPLGDGSPEFIYERDENGQSVVSFKNWRGNWVTYPDVEDEDGVHEQ